VQVAGCRATSQNRESIAIGGDSPRLDAVRSTPITPLNALDRLDHLVEVLDVADLDGHVDARLLIFAGARLHVRDVGVDVDTLALISASMPLRSSTCIVRRTM
jgi:hypothetical protein